MKSFSREVPDAVSEGSHSWGFHVVMDLYIFWQSNVGTVKAQGLKGAECGPAMGPICSNQSITSHPHTSSSSFYYYPHNDIVARVQTRIVWEEGVNFVFPGFC